MKNFYISSAIIILNTLILSFVIIFIAWLMQSKEETFQYSKNLDLTTYTTSSKEEAIALGHEFDQMADKESFAFFPWTVFISREFKGKLLNVSKKHIRKTVGLVKDNKNPDFVVWAFGGSTLFGWGVSDSQTIASHLQQNLNQLYPNKKIKVVNYGNPYFYSSMEVSYYLSLLRSKKRKPDLVIFLDGLNDSNYLTRDIDEPWFTKVAELAWEKERTSRYNKHGKVPWIEFNKTFPLTPLITWIQFNLGLTKGEGMITEIPIPKPEPEKTKSAVEKFLTNIKMAQAVSERLKIKTLHFLQPVKWSSKKYNIDKPANQVAFYQEVLEQNWPELIKMNSILDEQDLAYVDHSHYSEQASKIVADTIAEKIAKDF